MMQQTILIKFEKWSHFVPAQILIIYVLGTAINSGELEGALAEFLNDALVLTNKTDHDEVQVCFVSNIVNSLSVQQCNLLILK